MADNYRRLLTWLKYHLSTDIWTPFANLRASNYKKRYEDYDQRADERAIDEDESEDLSPNLQD